MIGALTACAVAALAWLGYTSLQPAQAKAIPLSHASLASQKLFSAHDCATCHADMAQQWQVSAHAHAVGDQYYQSLATMFIQERGVEAVRYCATCHNPIGLMQGEVDLQAAQNSSASQQPNAYQARELGIALPISAQAAGDLKGQPIELHRFWMATQILSDTRLAPMETRRIPYQINLAGPAPSPYRLTVRLLYRDVSQAFAEFALERAVPELPIREMARAEVVVR